MPGSKFVQQVPIPSGSNKLSGEVLTALAGLDMVTPTENMKEGRTPDSKNFRLYHESQAGREVAVSTRKGPGFYVEPLTEALRASQDTFTGHIVLGAGNILADSFIAGVDGNITKLDLHLQTLDGTGPLRVDLYSDNDGKPGTKLSESSFTAIPTEGWVTCRFLNAIPVSSTTKLWVVIYQQDDCTGTYGVGNVATGTAQFSNSSLLGLVTQTYGLAYKVYGTTGAKDKNGYRFNRETGDNTTVVVFGDTLYKVDETTHTYEVVVSGLNAAATEYSFTNADGSIFWVNGYDQLKRWDGTTVETITDSELPILSMILFHKNILFGVSATDPNKIVFSEAPGNPTNNPVDKQWYRAWLSVSFIYVPRPMNGSPITGLFSFQDSLIIITQDKKYVLSGSDRGSFYLRESTGSKGAISRKAMTSDANYIYFLSDDGIYRFNGSKDEKISTLINPLVEKVPRKEDVTMVVWKNQLRVYMPSELSPVNDICAILDLDFQEWMLDTNTYVNRAIYYGDADDKGELIEFSSYNGAAYKAEQDFNSLGAPIDFDYRLKYNSFGTPAQRKKIKRFFPLLQAVGSTFNITHGVDIDMADSPREQLGELKVGGNTLGTFQLDGSVMLSGKIAFQPKKVSVSGNARTFQYRVSRNAVDNQVAFMGVQLTYKTKRL